MQILALMLPLVTAPEPLPLAGDDPVQPPPGMVLIPGGRTKVGSSPKDIERLLEENPPLRDWIGPFSGETPQRTVDVDDFFLMVTEVTNEQYAAFVHATGGRPPQHWGEEAIAEALAAFLKEEAEKRKAAVDAGEQPPERRKFEPGQWWLENWEGKPWEVPEGVGCKPVIWVDYQDALGYARWAGLRLMSEEEYQRAVRGDKEQPYPWGDAWETGKYAATSEIQKINGAFPVGHFEEGASAQGVFDLAGNVWEWTSSKYTGYDGHKAMELTFGRGSSKKTYDTPPGFSPDKRVAVGGCWQTSRHLARGTIRRGSTRYQQTNSMGFRCAASLQPGRDMAETILRDLPPELRPRNVNGPVPFDPSLTMALDRWVPGKASCEVPGYGVIADYDFIMFTPVQELYQITMRDLREYSVDEHILTLGFLSTNQPIMEPALEAGTYLVAFRGAGETVVPEVEEQPEGEEGQEQATPPAPRIEDQIPIDVKQDNYVLIDFSGKPVAAVPAKGAELSRPAPGGLVVFDKTVQIEVQEGEETKLVPEVQKWLKVKLAVPARARKAFLGDLELRLAEEILARDWRGK